MRNKNIAISIVLLLLISCGKDRESLRIELKPLTFSMNCSTDSLRSYIESKKIELVHEDSHEYQDKGVDLFYLGLSENGLSYYIEFFFLSQKLSGVRITLYSKDFSLVEFKRRVRTETFGLIRNAANSKTISVDTISSYSPRPEFLIFVKAQELRDKIK